MVSAIVMLFAPGSHAQQLEHANGSSGRSPQPGKRTFTATCAGCHGLDGRGGERGPNIAGSAKLQRLSDAEIANIVSTGVPGTGMPAFGSLGAPEVQAVVSYFRFLQGRHASIALPGDPSRGKTTFFGKAECSSCHMMQGQGGFLGPDLSNYGAARSVTEILDVITHPAGSNGSGQKFVAAVTHSGLKVTGLVRNEDNFSLQLLTPEGTFYFLQKSDLESLEYQDRPVMPLDYSQRLSSAELNDLASYLMSVGRSQKADRPVNRQEE